MSDLSHVPEQPPAPPPDALDEELRAFDAEEAAAPPAGEPTPGAEPSAGEFLDENTIRVYLNVPFDFLAARKGEHWKLTEGELVAAVPLLTRVANKWAPEFLKQWGDEIGLGIMFGMIFLTRVNIDSEKAAEAKRASAAPAAI